MKNFFNRQNFNVSIQAFFVLAGIVLFYALVQNFSEIASVFGVVISRTVSILMPFIIGFSIAYLLNPTVIFFERILSEKFVRIRENSKVLKSASIFCTYLIFFGILSGLISYVLPQFFQSVIQLIDQLTKGYSTYQTQIEQYAEMIDMQQYLDLSLLKGDDLSEAVKTLLPIVFSKAYSLTSTLFNFIMGIVISMYVLYDKTKFINGANKIIYILTPEKHFPRMQILLEETNRAFKSFFVGKSLDSIIIGIICFIGLLIMKNPYPLVIAVIVGITNMIPYFGPLIGAVPSVVITVIYSPIMGLWLILFIFALQQFDGLILGPKILGDTTGVEPFWVLLAIIVGGALFGVLGMLLGVPVFSVIYNLVQEHVNRRYDEKVSIEK